MKAGRHKKLKKGGKSAYLNDLPKAKLKVTGYTPHEGQRILHHYLDKYPYKRYFAIRTPRQWGKTTFLLNEALNICINKPKSYLWYTVPFYKQAKEIFKNKLLPVFRNIDKRLISYINKSTYEIKFANGSIIQFHSVENFEGLRSATLTHLICDEFAYFRPGAFELVLSPMLDVKGERVIFSSTPKGKNTFYDYCQRGNPKSDTYNYQWAEFVGDINQTNNADLISRQLDKKNHLPDHIFRQEYLAEFIDSGGKVFKNIDRIFTLNDFAEPTARNYVGVDLGQESDRTVVVILNQNGEMVYFKRFEVKEQQDAPELSKALTSIITNFSFCRGFIETNFNSAILDYVRLTTKLVYAFKTLNPNKNSIINNLSFAIDLGALAAPEIPSMRFELQNYESGYSAVRRLITYSAPAGQHDDTVIALALAYKSLRNWEAKFRKLQIIEDEDDNEQDDSSN